MSFLSSLRLVCYNKAHIVLQDVMESERWSFYSWLYPITSIEYISLRTCPTVTLSLCKASAKQSCTVMLLNCVGVDCSMTLFLPANYTIYLSILQLLLIQTLPFSYPLFFFCEHLWALHFLETIQRATQIHGKANNVIKWYHYYVCFYKV